MPITQQQAGIVARSVAAAYEKRRRSDTDPAGHRGHPDIAEALGRAAFDAIHRVALAAGDEELVDVRHSYTYVTAFRTTIKMTVLVATDQRLWVVRAGGTAFAGAST